MIYSFQHIGSRVRQEDSYHIDSNKMLFIVCDGVGGSDAGEIASAHVIQSIVATLSKSNVMPLCVNCISKAIVEAQRSLNELAALNNNLGQAGTTLALLHIYDGNAITAHLGDSKVILLKEGGNLLWSTKDHSTVQELFDAGLLESESEMKTHPLKNRITNAIFTNQNPNTLNITTNELRNIEIGDQFVLCTDGVLESIDIKQLSNLFSGDPKKSVLHLSNIVRLNSKDNSTLIYVKPSKKDS